VCANERSRPLVDALQTWLRKRRAKLSGKSETDDEVNIRGSDMSPRARRNLPDEILRCQTPGEVDPFTPRPDLAE